MSSISVQEIVDKECWYVNAYPMIESLMGNLAFIGENGIEQFLQREKVRWTCSDCGGCISVHDGVCYGCGKNIQIENIEYGKYNSK